MTFVVGAPASDANAVDADAVDLMGGLMLIVFGGAAIELPVAGVP